MSDKEEGGINREEEGGRGEGMFLFLIIKTTNSYSKGGGQNNQIHGETGKLQKTSK